MSESDDIFSVRFFPFKNYTREKLIPLGRNIEISSYAIFMAR